MASKKRTRHTTRSSMRTAAAAAGISAAVAVGAAVAYYFWGSHSTQRQRRKIRGWVLRAMGEVADRLERIGTVTIEDAEKAIEAVATRYARLAHVGEQAAQQWAAEMKRHWKRAFQTRAPSSRGSLTSSRTVARRAQRGRRGA